MGVSDLFLSWGQGMETGLRELFVNGGWRGGGGGGGKLECQSSL